MSKARTRQYAGRSNVLRLLLQHRDILWRVDCAGSGPRAKRTQHRKNENLRPRLIAGGAGKLGRGLAQPSDNPILRLPDVILAFNEWQLKQASNLARMEASTQDRRGRLISQIKRAPTATTSMMSEGKAKGQGD